MYKYYFQSLRVYKTGNELIGAAVDRHQWLSLKHVSVYFLNLKSLYNVFVLHTQCADQVVPSILHDFTIIRNQCVTDYTLLVRKNEHRRVSQLKRFIFINSLQHKSH